MQPQLPDDLFKILQNVGERLQSIEKSLTNDAVPIGTSIDWTGPLALLPFNYLPADGRALDRVAYATYFAEVGITHGAGDGVSTFNIPDISTVTALVYTEITSSVSVTGTSGAPTTVITGPSQVLIAGDYRIDFFTPELVPAASDQVIIDLWNSTTQLGQMGLCGAGGTTPPGFPSFMRRKVTLTAGTYQFIIKAWRVSGNGTIGAGTGAAGNANPSYLAVSRETSSVIKVL